MSTWKATLVATVIGTAVGVGAWALDLTRLAWPDHPQLAGFLLTLATTVLVRMTWPTARSGS